MKALGLLLVAGPYSDRAARLELSAGTSRFLSALCAPPALTCHHFAASEQISKLCFWLRKVRYTHHCAPTTPKN